MSKTPYQVQDLAATDQLLTPYVVLPYRTATTTVGAPATGVFHSTIIGRAKMVDLSNDLGVRMGIERIQVQSIMRVDGEVGPAGEAVFKPANDKFDQIRFIGNWNIQNGVRGPVMFDGASVEISFYGTGLNVLFAFQAGTVTYNYTVDGGSSSSFLSSFTPSSILSGRNYTANNVVSVVSGLALGLHTIKITDANAGVFGIAGFEILNTASTLSIAAGTALVNGTAASLSAATTSAYNSGFESGTLGTRGGRVLVYMKNDGTIGKAVTPTDAASLTLTSASHANEEVIRNYFWREFGAGRTDDFSTLTTSASARAFTLDDGTTTLATSSAVANLSPIEAVSPRAAGFITFTFVGTGLDLLRYDDTNGGADTYEFRLDGTLIQTQTAGNTATRITKIVSGLPYGTHTLRIDRVSAVTWNPYIANFIVYGPKKPTIPAGAMELADYNIMATFVANTTEGSGRLSTGVLRKVGIREAVYSGTWDAISTIDANTEAGFYIRATANASYVEYTFFGTGFDLRHGAASNGDPASQLTLNGSTNFSAYTTSFYGTGINFTAATGVLDQQGSDTYGVGVVVSGLPLGTHKLRVSKTSGTYIYAYAIDIITPIHTHKNNGPFVLQNTLSVGSQGISDGRKLPITMNDSPISVRMEALIANSVTTSTAVVPIGDMATAIYVPQDSNLEVLYSGTAYGSGNYYRLQVFIDGVGHGKVMSGGVSGSDVYVNCECTTPVTKGWHFIAIHHGTNTGTVGTELGTDMYGRRLKVKLSPVKS